MISKHHTISYKEYHARYHSGDSALDHNCMTLSYRFTEEGTQKYLENQKLNPAHAKKQELLSKQEWRDFLQSRRHRELLEIRQGRAEAMEEIALAKALAEHPELRNQSLSLQNNKQNQQNQT